MKLETLIAEFKYIDAKLSSLLLQDGSLDLIRDLDKKTQNKLNKIKEYQPQGLDELKSKFKFFINKLTSDANESSDCFSIEALVHILDNDLSLNINTLIPEYFIENSISSEDNRFKQISAYDLVSKSHDRVSIICKDYKYVNTSNENGNFYNQNSNSMIGKHVVELIGENRFQQRAKTFFKKCFNGEKQDYFHSLKVNGRKRIMNCQMTPLYNTEASVFGSIVTMNDVTHIIADKNSVVIQEL